MSTNLVTRAIVLRRVNYGEADRILTILTPDNGQQSVIAKGVRKEKSKLAGGIELFAICELGLVRGDNNQSGMWTLTSSRIITFYDKILEDYDRLEFGYKIIKDITQLSDNIEAPEVYDLLSQSLEVLNNTRVDLRLIKTWYYLRLAKLNGNEINLMTDSNGMKLVEDATYEYDVTEKVLRFINDGRITTDIIKLMRVLNYNDAGIITRLSGLAENTISEALNLARIVAESS